MARFPSRLDGNRNDEAGAGLHPIHPKEQGAKRAVTVSRGWPLLQVRILRLGFLQGGDVGVGVGVFPEGEEVLIGGASRHSIQKGFAGGFLLAHVIEHPDTAGKVLHR
jgi:hypothetical protein